MSIVTILKNEEFPDFKYYIKTNVPRKKAFVSNVSCKPFSKIEMCVDYGQIKPSQARAIGTISDYMFCLVLARFVSKNKDTIYESLNYSAIQIYERCIKNNFLTNDRSREKQHFEDAIRATKNYVYNKNDTIEAVIQAAYTITKMDNYLNYNAWGSKEQFFSSLLMTCEDEVVAQVKQLICVFQNKFIESGLVHENSTVICHLSFDPWSFVCGGGVADIYIDGVLYDFKSTKDIGYHWEDVGQVYAYYLLSCLVKRSYDQENSKDENNQTEELDVKKIAVYFSRYGDIESCDLLQCGKNVSDEDLIWLESIINQRAEEQNEKLRELNRILECY